MAGGPGNDRWITLPIDRATGATPASAQYTHRPANRARLAEVHEYVAIPGRRSLYSHSRMIVQEVAA